MVLMKGMNKTVMEKRYETNICMEKILTFCAVCQISPLNILMSYFF